MDQPSPTLVMTLGAVIASLVGVIAWVLKSALPALLNIYREDMEKRDARYAADLEKRDQWYASEMAKRDATLERMNTVLDKLADEIRDLKRAVNVSSNSPPQPK